MAVLAEEFTFMQICTSMNAQSCHVQETEEFYACEWSVNVHTGTPLLLLAGKRGLLKVVSCDTEAIVTVSSATIVSFTCCLQVSKAYSPAILFTGCMHGLYSG